jgi:alpha-tubulin suppressor-like RCC1 family protein
MGRQWRASWAGTFGRTAGERSRSRLRCALVCAAALAVAAFAPALAQAEEGEGGEAVAWGRNTKSQLGAGFSTNPAGEESPVTVLGLGDIVEMASGQGNAEHGFALARLSNGTVEGWGDGEFGVLGKGEGEHKGESCVGETKLEEGKEEEEAEPEIPGKVRVGSLSDVKQIAAAGTAAAALLSDGDVDAWGNNEEGGHGNGKGGFVCETGESDGTIAEVKGLSHVKAIATGDGADLALVENEGKTEVQAWGRNIENNLDLEEPSKEQQKKEKEEVKEDEKEKEERKHEEEEGKELAPPKELPERRCNTDVGVVQCSKVPRPVLGLKEVAEKETTKEKEEDVHITAITAGGSSYAALYSNGTIRVWGGSVDDWGGPEKEFEKVAGVGTGETFGPAVAVADGRVTEPGQLLALLASGKVVGWGNDERGELGPDPEECKTASGKHKCFKTPTEISGLEDITAISAGWQSTFALSSSGTLYALGFNKNGQLGIGSAREKTETATEVGGIGAVSQIAAGERSVYAVLDSGVKAPSPALTVTAENHSGLSGFQELIASYTFKNVSGKGFKKCIRVSGSGKCPSPTHLSTAEEEAKSFKYEELENSTLYTILLSNGERTRAITAETLP